MGDAKRLNPEGLSKALRKVSSGTSTEDTERALRGHIAALEAELSRLKPSAQVAEDEELVRRMIWPVNGDHGGAQLARSALSNLAAKAQGYEAAIMAWDDAARVPESISRITGPLSPEERRYEMRPPTPGERLLQKYWEMYGKIEKERDAAVADNAALLAVAKFWEEELEDVAKNGTGADLGWMDQDKAKAMLAVIRSDHPGATLPEEHRKALVRARNEGLEKVAGVIGALVAAWHRVKESKAWATASIGEYLEERIRSLKESEQ